MKSDRLGSFKSLSLHIYIIIKYGKFFKSVIPPISHLFVPPMPEFTLDTTRETGFSPGWEGPLVPVFPTGTKFPGLKVTHGRKK